MSLKIQVYEDDAQQQQQYNNTPDDNLRKQLSQSDPKWFIKPSNYHQLAELEIYPRVFLGSQWEAKDPEWFATHKISHVLNVSTLQNTFQKKALFYPTLTTISSSLQCSDSENVNPNIIANHMNGVATTPTTNVNKTSTTTQIHINYLKINVDDSTDVKISKYFDKAISFVRDALEGSPSNNVLIHCKEGKSRSVTMMLAFGMSHLNLSLFEAFKHFEHKTFNRSRINLGFQLQLMNFEVELLQSNNAEKPKNTLDFLNPAAVHSCRIKSTGSPTIEEPATGSTKRTSRKTKKSPLTDITNTQATSVPFQQANSTNKPKRSTVKLLPPKKVNTMNIQPTSTPVIVPPIIKQEEPIIIVTSSDKDITLPDTSIDQQQQPVTPLRSPIRSARRSNHRTPSSIIKIPFSTLDNASYISPLKNRIPPTPIGTPSINNADILTDDYSSLDFNFDEDDLEISKGMEDRVFMTTPLKKRKTDEDPMQSDY